MMLESGLKKMEGNTNTMALQANPPAVEIVDPAAIPLDFLEITTSTRPMKAEIKAAILGGAQIPGAKLTQGLRLKRT